RRGDGPAGVVRRGGPVRGRHGGEAGAGPVPRAGGAAGRSRIRGRGGAARGGRRLAGRCFMTTSYLAGAVVGLGLFLLGLALYPPKPRLARRLAAFDATRRGANGHWAAGPDVPAAGPRWRRGSWLARLCAEPGLRVASLPDRHRLAALPRA